MHAFVWIYEFVANGLDGIDFLLLNLGIDCFHFGICCNQFWRRKTFWFWMKDTSLYSQTVFGSKMYFSEWLKTALMCRFVLPGSCFGHVAYKLFLLMQQTVVVTLRPVVYLFTDYSFMFSLKLTDEQCAISHGHKTIVRSRFNLILWLGILTFVDGLFVEFKLVLHSCTMT